MRVGLVGPASGEKARLREAVRYLVEEAKVDQVVYLGADDAVDAVVSEWAAEIMPGGSRDEAFLAGAARVAVSGTAEEIDALLAADARVARLECLRKLPEGARAIEMLDDRIVLLVHDKALLDEEDIANAFLIAYGKAKTTSLNRFGPRYFFTPGPLSEGKIGLIESDGEGEVVLSVKTARGEPVSREVLKVQTATKMTVST